MTLEEALAAAQPHPKHSTRVAITVPEGRMIAIRDGKTTIVRHVATMLSNQTSAPDGMWTTQEEALFAIWRPA